MAEEYVVAKEEPVCGVAPVSLGIGSMLRIPVPGSKGLSIELSPRGWTPKGGTSSSLFIQDLTGKRHLRLDFGYNKNSQATEWHWNQKGTQADFGIKNHSSVGAEEQALGEFAADYRVGGRVLLVAGAAIDAYSMVTSSRPLRRSVQVVSGWTGAMGDCKLLGAGGAEIGTLVAPGLGTAVGGFFGCVVPRFPIEFGGGGAGGSW